MGEYPGLARVGIQELLFNRFQLGNQALEVDSDDGYTTVWIKVMPCLNMVEVIHFKLHIFNHNL